MTLLGKIMTVLIFIMSVVFMALAMATFATHRNWRELADNNDASNPGLKQRIEKLVEDNNKYKALLEQVRMKLAEEQAARRAAISNLHGKLAYSQSELLKVTEDYKKNLDKFEAKQARAKDLTASLEVATKRIEDLDVKLRAEQVDRETQFQLAVKYNELLNQALSSLDNLKERRKDLEEQFALLAAKATAAGIDVTDLKNLLADRPPEIDAKVTQVNATNTLVELSIGSDDGIKKGHVLMIHRGDNFLGTISIKDIESDRAVGEVDKKLQRGQIRKGDQATTKFY